MADMETSHQHCRFYFQPWPEVGDVIMATVMEVKDSASYVTLPEYGDQEAMLPHSELSNRRLRSLHKHVQKGQTLCVRVTRVCPDKGYVDVSKRQVDEEGDRRECRERYARGKTVQSVIWRLGELLGTTSSEQLEDLNQRITWKLDTLHERLTAAYDVFNQAYSEPDVLKHLGLDDVTLGLLTQVISHRFALKQIKVRSEVEVMCFGTEGVDAIKHALNAGKMAAPAALPVEIVVLAPPCYIVTCLALTNQKEEALASLQQAMDAIQSTIKQYSGGQFHLRNQPTVNNDISTSQTGA